MSTGKKYPTLPENADKILFAEDLVNHVLSKLNLPLLSSGIEDHRTLIHNAFNSEIRLAVDSCFDDLDNFTNEVLQAFLKKKRMRIRDFVKFATFYKSWLGVFVPDTKTEFFLLLCVRVSIMAGKFYRHGIVDALDITVDQIVSIIESTDMVEEGGWEALNTLSRDWAQKYVDSNKNCLTPEYDGDSNSSISSDESEETDEDDVGVTDEEYRNIFIDSCSSSEEEPVLCRSSEKACTVVTSDNVFDSTSAGSSRDNKSKSSFHLVQNISKDVSSKQNPEKDRNEKPSCSYSGELEFHSKKCKTDVQIPDDMCSFDGQSTDECSSMMISHPNNFYKSDLMRFLEVLNSSNLTTENVDRSSTEGGIKTPAAESGRRKKSVPKKREVLASKR